jgi:Na+/H+-dicarboxylate symporter
MAFVPTILEALSDPQVPSIWNKIRPTHILWGLLAILIPTSVITAFREGNRFAHLAVLSFVAGVALVVAVAAGKNRKKTA